MESEFCFPVPHAIMRSVVYTVKLTMQGLGHNCMHVLHKHYTNEELRDPT